MFNNLFGSNCCNQNTTCEVVYEQPINNCIQKDFVHEIKHIVPINTNVINNHIYKNTYIPEYTCSQENICTNIYDNCPNKF
jgi:hypothetical protein